jgi:hypothetical protein
MRVLCSSDEVQRHMPLAEAEAKTISHQKLAAFDVEVM